MIADTACGYSAFSLMPAGCSLVTVEYKINILSPARGYVAPPLDGIWATAPYLHTGSVPTIWDLLHPAAQRPRALVLLRRQRERLEQRADHRKPLDAGSLQVEHGDEHRADDLAAFQADYKQKTELNRKILDRVIKVTDDEAYQAFRRQVRDPAWIEAFLAQPLAARRAFADRARAASGEHQSALKAQDALETITDVNADTVAATMARYGVRRLIHGHTHRPAVHALASAGRPARRIVLGDWYEQGSVLRVDADGVPNGPSERLVMAAPRSDAAACQRCSNGVAKIMSGLAFTLSQAFCAISLSSCPALQPA